MKTLLILSSLLVNTAPSMETPVTSIAMLAPPTAPSVTPETVFNYLMMGDRLIDGDQRAWTLIPESIGSAKGNTFIISSDYPTATLVTNEDELHSLNLGFHPDPSDVMNRYVCQYTITGRTESNKTSTGHFLLTACNDEFYNLPRPDIRISAELPGSQLPDTVKSITFFYETSDCIIGTLTQHSIHKGGRFSINEQFNNPKHGYIHPKNIKFQVTYQDDSIGEMQTLNQKIGENSETLSFFDRFEELTEKKPSTQVPHAIRLIINNGDPLNISYRIKCGYKDEDTTTSGAQRHVARPGMPENDTDLFQCITNVNSEYKSDNNQFTVPISGIADMMAIYVKTACAKHHADINLIFVANAFRANGKLPNSTYIYPLLKEVKKQLELLENAVYYPYQLKEK